MTLRAKFLAAVCGIAVIVVGTVVVDAGGDVGVTTKRPPSTAGLASRATPKAPQAIKQRLQNLQRQHRMDHRVSRLTASQRRASKKAARALFGKTHPRLAKSAGVRAADTKAHAAATSYYVYTDWFKTNDDNAWLGIEWWYNGNWYGYTVTWDPSFGTWYGNQYLYYSAGSYYGYYYWR